MVQRVVEAVRVPVTVKMRLGWDATTLTAPAFAREFEKVGVAAVTIHGRTRECGFSGQVEYDTIREVKRSVRLPVAANGDIDSPEKALGVLERTGADAVMIGRAAQGRPWIFREVHHYLDRGERLPPPCVEEIRALIVEHLGDHYALYGEETGVKTARKHLGWYARGLAGGEAFRNEVNRLETAAAQLAAVDRFFDRLADRGERLAYAEAPAQASWEEEALAA